MTSLILSMSALVTTDATASQEEQNEPGGLCLICTLPIREPGEEPDALLCSQCGVVYHRVCAPNWTSECYECLGKEVVSTWTRSLPPGQRQPTMHACVVDGCEFQTKHKHVLKQHQAAVHGIGDVESIEGKNRRQNEYQARLPVQPCGTGGIEGCEYQARWESIEGKNRRQRERAVRQPVPRCGIEGCEYQAQRKAHLQEHQARVHGIGDVESIEEKNRRQKEYQARMPVKRCGIEGCEFQTKRRNYLREHQARVHGIGDVESIEEKNRKHKEYQARLPVQRCGIEGCEFQTKRKQHLQEHQARIHGIGDVEYIEEKKRRQKERVARMPVQRCGFEGCEFQTKYKHYMKEHQARIHGIGDAGAFKTGGKRKGGNDGVIN